jgi:hypothetical protein
VLDESYLEKGITGLARAIDHSWNQGHMGCAVIASTYLCRDVGLAAEAESEVRSEVDKMIAAYSHLFVPLDTSSRSGGDLEQIPRALEGNISRLCPGGHNVIYATLALKALRQMPQMITPEVVAGIARLIDAFTVMSPPSNMFGIAVDSTASVDAPGAYADAASIAAFTFNEVLAFQPMYYEIQGVVGHLVTHAHMLIELSELGYPELAERAYGAHQEHVQRVRLFHDRFDVSRWTPVHPDHPDPLNPLFWARDREAMAADSWGYGHFFKYRYQFYDLLERVQDPGLRRACRARMADYIMNDFKGQGRMPAKLFVPIAG